MINTKYTLLGLTSAPDAEPLSVQYDYFSDELIIEGQRYSAHFFRNNSMMDILSNDYRVEVINHNGKIMFRRWEPGADLNDV